MKEYLKAQNKTNETILGNVYSSDELDRFSKSDYRWADNRTKPFQHRIVIGVKQKLLYVLPIFSYDSHKHPDVYHPIDYPNSKSDMFLLKKCEFSFITHDSVLKLNDIRTVSVNRILYQQNGRISPSSVTYKQIEKLVLQKYFPSFYHNFEQNIQTITSLNEQLKEAIEINNVLEAKNEQLKTELKALKNQPSSPKIN